jgi:hypothetical protein
VPGEYRVTPLADSYWATTAGATGRIRLPHAEDHRRLYHLEGRYERDASCPHRGAILLL